MNKETVMYQITENSPFMMSFVIITKENNAIIIDGGREEDMPLLKEHVGGRHVSAWIITHGHQDHISGMVEEYKKNKWAEFDIEKIYCNLPDPKDVHPSEVECIPDFLSFMPEIGDKVHVTLQGESIEIDELKIDFIFSYHKEIKDDLMNNSSLVFKVTGEKKSVMFLGDIGPEAGDYLYRESRHLLKADIVQMAHHGGFGCGMEIYASIRPEACLWCCREENYEGKKIGAHTIPENYVSPLRRYLIPVTREWMDILGVKTHYVTKDGTNKIVI